jgi:hypothetical protein
MNGIPRLDDDTWFVNGASVIAWINHTECYEIVPGEVCGFALSLNNVATAESQPLGVHGDIDAAKLAARRHVGDE